VDPQTGGIYVDYYDIFTVGAGYLDLQAAMNGINQVPTSGSAMSPVASHDDTNGIVTLGYDGSSVWSTQAVWGNKAMWGLQAVWSSSVLVGNQAVWGTKALWGLSNPTASKAMWGLEVNTASKAMWGTANLNAAESVMVAGEN